MLQTVTRRVPQLRQRNMAILCLAPNSKRTCLFFWAEILSSSEIQAQIVYREKTAKENVATETTEQKRADRREVFTAACNAKAKQIDKSDSLLCVAACGDDLQSSQREMNASPNARCVCVHALHVKHTADPCHHWILLWPTGGHKGQIEESGASQLSSSPFSYRWSLPQTKRGFRGWLQNTYLNDVSIHQLSRAGLYFPYSGTTEILYEWRLFTAEELADRRHT